MKNIFVALLCLCVLSFAACDNGPRTVVFSPQSANISYMGRVVPNDSDGVSFNFPGVTALFEFRGTDLTMKAAPGSGQFMVYIDDLEPFKANFSDSISEIVLVDSLADDVHNAKIVYAIEGYEHNPEFRGFVVRGEDPTIMPVKRPALKMEFIGNSITCGYGAESDNPDEGFSYDTENSTMSYAYLTARNLNANFNIVARSGIGMYRNYGGAREGDSLTLPDEYDWAMLYNHDRKWDHSSFHPQVICINLGTNDTSLDNYDISLYEKKYDAFIKKLRRLHPNAKIVLLSGSMLSGKALEDVRGALDRLAEANEGTYRFDMSPQTGDLGYGADYHPSAAQHRRMAEELTTYIRTNVLD